MIILFLLIAAVKADESYDAYLQTTFRNNLIPEVNHLFDTYHNDRRDLDVTLPFVDVSDRIIFRYSAEEPYKYHVKRTYYFALLIQDDIAMFWRLLHDIFTHSAENATCSHFQHSGLPNVLSATRSAPTLYQSKRSAVSFYSGRLHFVRD